MDDHIDTLYRYRFLPTHRTFIFFLKIFMEFCMYNFLTCFPQFVDVTLPFFIYLIFSMYSFISRHDISVVYYRHDITRIILYVLVFSLKTDMLKLFEFLSLYCNVDLRS